MSRDANDHWNEVYRSKPVEKVSWFETTPAASLDALERAGAGPNSSLIDIGGGAAVLVDRLLDLGWRDLAVLDISATALAVSQARLGTRADLVNWHVADIAVWTPERRYDLWHDRAVFHFLTTTEGRADYRRALAAGLAPGGHAILAVFAIDGPERCSGLRVCRYDAAGLRREFETDFDVVEHWTADHRTPQGDLQPFTWAILRKRS